METKNRWQVWKFVISYGIPVLSAILISVIYWTSHQYPTLAGGFYLAVGDSILDSLPQIATKVPHYTHNGVRLGMPPFAATIAALLSRVADSLTVAFVLPLIYYIGATVAGTYLAKTYYGDSVGNSMFAIIVGVVLGTSPAAYFWHITAGGTVRALAYLFFLLVVAMTIQVFRNKQHERVILLGIFVGLSISSHPFYGFMSCAAVFLGFVSFELTIDGFRRGFVVAAIAIGLASTWLLPFILNHGLDLYLGVSQTRGGLIHFTWSPLNRIYTSSFRGPFRPFWVYLGLLGLSASAVQQRYFLIALLTLSVYAIPRPRFMIVPLVMISGLLLVKDIPQLLNILDVRSRSVNRDYILVAIIVVLILPTIWMGLGYESTPYVDNSGVDVADWAKEETTPQATFIIADDSAEWFPLLANRTSLVAPRGSEWDPTGIRAQELEERRILHNCNTENCIEKIIRLQPVKTDYIVVPKETIISSTSKEQSALLLNQLCASDQFVSVYRNDRFIIFDVHLRDKYYNSTTN